MGFCDDNTIDLLNLIFGSIMVGVALIANLIWSSLLLGPGRQRVNKGKTLLEIVSKRDKYTPIAESTAFGDFGIDTSDLEQSGWTDAGYNAKDTSAKQVEFDESTARELLKLYHDVHGMTPEQMQTLRESDDDSKYRNEHALDPKVRAALFSTAVSWYKENEARLKDGQQPKKSFNSEFEAALLAGK